MEEKDIYNKAVNKILSKLAARGMPSDMLQSLSVELQEDEAKAKVLTGKEKPSIYFTRLNSSGELEADWEKTLYYRDHPEELCKLSKTPGNFPKNNTPKKESKSYIEISKTNSPKTVQKIIKELTKDKTLEMCELENKACFKDLVLNGKDAYYWNALATQISSIYLDDELYAELFKLCKANNIQDALNHLSENNALLTFREIHL